MPKLAGRRAFYAALAVPIAMVIAPLTASAGVADHSAVTEHAQLGAVATESDTAAVTDAGGFSDGPGWHVVDDADVVHDESEETSVTYVVNGIHDGTVIGNSSDETTVVEHDGFSPGPDWYWAEDGDYGDDGDDVDVVHSESEQTQVTYVVNGIYNDSVVGNSAEETTVFETDGAEGGFAPGPEWYHADDVDVVHSESEETQVTYVVNGIHNNTVIGNSSEENTYVGDGVDEEEVVVVHDHGDGYEHGGAYGDDSDYGFDGDYGSDEGYGYDDDHTTATSFEEMTAVAGYGGAFVDSTESGTFDQD